MLRNTLRRNKGITLIALVVTIIVLLILAGISIAMLTGQNGILNRAAEAKEKTGVAQEDESQKLKGYEDTINQYAPSSNGGNTGGGSEGGSLPTGTGTTPYLPNSTFSKKEGDLATGLVIKDNNDNEYVWVEVPTTIYDNTTYNNNGAKKPSNSEDYTNIEACLKSYTDDYENSSSYSDTKFTEQYQAMLKSVYTNGGFWIGRYEAGYEIDESKGEKIRDYGTDYTTEYPITQKVVIKKDAYPYNWVRRDQAQTLAGSMDYDGVTSSLIFGIQWDLVLKYIEEKTVAKVEESNKSTVRADIQNKLASNSTSIGNYYNSSFELKRGKFAKFTELSDWKAYNSEEKPTLVTGSKKKEQSSFENAIILTTGATEATNLQNIYDIAGNVSEWTLEFCYTESPCVYRGGNFGVTGSQRPALDRGHDITSYSFINLGFRLGLWK